MKQNNIPSTGRRVNSVLAFSVLFAILLGLSGFGTAYGQPNCEDISYVETPDGEVLVGDVEELQCLTERVTGNVRLTSSIEASGTENWNNGSGFEPIGPTFRGTFDGDGNVIFGLTIDRKSDSEVGLFSSISSTASVKNMRLEKVDVAGNKNVGGLVGKSEGEVVNSSVTGSVVGEGNAVGGLIGRNVAGTVARSYTNSEVRGNRHVGGLLGRNTGEVRQSYANSTVRGDTNIGGLVGYNLMDISNTYATGNVEGRVTIGGLVGQNRGKGRIIKSYATGTVDGAEAGALVGLNDDATVENSYIDTVTTGRQYRDREENFGIGLTTDEMVGDPGLDAMRGLDFENVWEIRPEDYPALGWETTEIELDPGGDDDGGEGEQNTPGEGGGNQNGRNQGETDDDGLSDDTDGIGESGTDPQGTSGNQSDEDEQGSQEEQEGLHGFGVFAGILGILGAARLSERVQL